MSAVSVASQGYDVRRLGDLQIQGGKYMAKHQRIGSISNAHVGREFEAAALEYFSNVEGLSLIEPFTISIGIAELKKNHRFDLGSENPAVLVECKSHDWTETGNMPSAKVTVWNEAMYYFFLAPSHFRKILFVLESRHVRQSETLAEYYVRINGHLIPKDVSIIEFNPESKAARYVKTA